MPMRKIVLKDREGNPKGATEAMIWDSAEEAEAYVKLHGWGTGPSTAKGEVTKMGTGVIGNHNIGSDLTARAKRTAGDKTAVRKATGDYIKANDNAAWKEYLEIVQTFDPKKTTAFLDQYAEEHDMTA